jgi:pilus assembly protein FimV
VPKTKPAPIPDAPFVKVASDAEPAAKPAIVTDAAAKPTAAPQREAKPAAVTEVAAKPAAAPERAAKPVISLLPTAKPLNLTKPQAAPACRKQPSEAESACVALDGKNAELRAEIGKLEARVNSLLAHENSRQPEVSKPAPQADMPPVAPKAEAHPVEASPGQAASGKVQPAGAPSRLSAKQAGRPHQKTVANEAEKPSMPWGWIAGAGLAVFAAVGALQFWRRRRKGAKSVTVHAPLPAEEENQAEPTLG